MRNSLRLAAIAALLAPPIAAQSWEPWYELQGQAEGDLLGYALAPIGDVNGDGIPDLLVGIYGDDTTGADAGAVELRSGAADGALLLRVEGDTAAALLGSALTDLGDLDGDNIPEFAAGAPWHSGSVFFGGRVYVYRGSDGLVLDTISGTGIGELLGGAVAGVDTDGDGLRELVVGAIGANGGDGEVRVYAWNGAAMSLQTTLPGVAGSAEALGYALASAGDLDGTPGEEFLVGAPFAAAEAGRVDLVAGGAVLLSLPGAVAGDHLGFSVAGNRDVDGDGWMDFAAGAPEAGGAAGEVRVWQGGPTAGTPALLALISGSAAGDRLGHAVALLEDNTFDGLAELVVGIPGAAGAGLVQVLDLNRTLPRAVHEVAGATGDHLGWAVAGVGDLDLQGREELAMSSPWASPGGLARQGRVEIWHSLPPQQGGGGNEMRPFRITLQQGILDERTVVDFLVENYRPGVDLYAYVGTEQTTSTSAEGFPLDISGPGGGTLTAFKVVPGVTGSSTTVSWFVPSTYVDGQELFFQFVEANANMVWRASNVDSGTVRKPLILDTLGTSRILDATDPSVTRHVAYVNESLQLQATNANANQDTYFYYSLTGPGTSQMNGFDLDLDSPIAWPGSPVTADPNGNALSQTITVPDTVAGRMIWVQSASDAPVGPAKKISNVVPILLTTRP